MGEVRTSPFLYDLNQMSKHLNLHIDEVGNADKPFLPSGRLNSRYPSCVILEP